MKMRSVVPLLGMLVLAPLAARADDQFLNETDVGVLIHALQDKDMAVQKSAAARMTRLVIDGTIAADDGKVRDALKQIFLQGQGDACFEAANTLAAMGAGSLDAILEGVKSENHTTRFYAIQIISTLALEHPQDRDKLSAAIPVLAGLVHDKDATISRAAVASLLRLGPGAKGALIDSFSNDAPELFNVDREVVRVLADMGTEALPDLLKAAQSDNSNVRRYATATLAKMKDPPKDVLAPILIKLLDDKDLNVRMSAVNSLVICGPLARPAMDHLLANLAADPSSGNAVVIASAIRAIGIEPRHLAPILAILPKIREDARYSLKSALAHSDPPLTDKLISLLGSAQLYEADAAAVALGETTPKPLEAIPELIKALSRKDLGATVMQTLGKIGPDAKDAVPALIDALKDGKWELPETGVSRFQSRAMTALLEIGAAGVPELRKGLASTDMNTQYGCVAVLAQVGNADAIPELLELARTTQSDSVQALVIGALNKFHAPADQLIPILKKIAEGNGSAAKSAQAMLLKLCPK